MTNIREVIRVYEEAGRKKMSYLSRRSIASMVVVDIYAIWERYAERRVAAGLNHNPQQFLADNGVRNLRRIPSTLATVLIRTGARYFDFRSISELIDRADRYLGRAHNPFRKIPPADRDYLDALAAIRNCVVHFSDAAWTSYRRSLRKMYGIKAAPEPDEFLDARDDRASSPARYRSRLHGLTKTLERTIRHT